MPSLTLKNIPDDLYDLLKQSAEMNRRSLSSEILVCIEKAVRSRRLSSEEVLPRARQLRELTADYRISNEELTEAKRQGRP
jgi:hypothetical protein